MVEQLVVLPEADHDLETAFRWYETRSPGRGMKFFRAVEECFQLIRRQPEFQERVRGDYRRAIVRRYPYAVIYQFVPDLSLVKVYTVFHCSQDPTKLADRLPPAD